MDAPKGLASYLDTVEGEEVDSSSVFKRFDWLSSPYSEIFFKNKSIFFLHFRFSPHLIWSVTFNSLLWRYYGGTIQHFHLQHSYQTLLQWMRWHNVQNTYQTLLEGMICSLVSPASSAQPVWMGWTSTWLLERADPPSLPTQGRSLECYGSGRSLSAPLLLGGCFCSPAPCPRSSPFFSTGFQWQI